MNSLLSERIGKYARLGEDLGGNRGVLNGGNDLQGAAAVPAVFDVDIEHPFEQPGSAQADLRRGASLGVRGGGIGVE